MPTRGLMCDRHQRGVPTFQTHTVSDQRTTPAAGTSILPAAGKGAMFTRVGLPQFLVIVVILVVAIERDEFLQHMVRLGFVQIDKTTLRAQGAQFIPVELVLATAPKDGEETRRTLSAPPLRGIAVTCWTAATPCHKWYDCGDICLAIPDRGMLVPAAVVVRWSDTVWVWNVGTPL